MIPAGGYLVEFYADGGGMIAGESMPARSLGQAIEIGERGLSLLRIKAASYTIVRCVFSSLDKD